MRPASPCLLLLPVLANVSHCIRGPISRLSSHFQHFSQLKQANPSDRATLTAGLALGSILLSPYGAYSQACEVLRQTLLLFSQFPTLEEREILVGRLGQALVEMHQPYEALSLLQPFIRLDPGTDEQLQIALTHTDALLRTEESWIYAVKTK